MHRSLPRWFRRLLLLGVGAGAACVAYGVLIERRWFRRRSYRLEVLPPNASTSLTLLHLSDLHLRTGQRAKRRFLASLQQPDILVVTGDFVGETTAVEIVVEALRPLRGRIASYFVCGSNDYYVPQPPNYARYFVGGRHRRRGVAGRGKDLVTLLEADGWIQLKNRKAALTAAGVGFEIAGMDDPHIWRHDLRAVARTEPDAVGLAVVHSPDPSPELAALGYDLILAGHTHGGQVRMPVVGALTTNSYMPNRLGMGLVSMPPSILHISPGMGTGRFAPFRFLCRPEATVLQLVGAPAA